MFESLQQRFQGIFRQLRAEGRVSEEHVAAAAREIRMALLEADVNFKVVRDELIALLGESGGELKLSGRPAVILLCGLQGSGKTTTAGRPDRRSSPPLSPRSAISSSRTTLSTC